MKITRLKNSRTRMNVILHVPRPGKDPTRYHFLNWCEVSDGSLMRFVFAPHKTVKPGEPVPLCPDCGNPLKKSGEPLSMISYEGDCLEVYDPDRGK
jgi:hypothetical protein